MTSKTNTTKKSINQTAIYTRANTHAVASLELVKAQTDTDFKNALLIVSLGINAIVLIAWIILKVTSQYDYQIANFLFYR